LWWNMCTAFPRSVFDRLNEMMATHEDAGRTVTMIIIGESELQAIYPELQRQYAQLQITDRLSPSVEEMRQRILDNRAYFWAVPVRYHADAPSFLGVIAE
jgi:F0F1-type ATP synthase gamma subunit